MSGLIENKKEGELDTQKNKFLTFLLGKESYGIEIKYVSEIIGMQEITHVPQLPDYVKGIINLRGKIIPVMDVRLRFKLKAKEYSDRTCIIIIEISDILIGLIVDSVSEVITIPEQNIQEPPQMSKNANNRYIKGIGKIGDSVKLLLDCMKLISDEDFNTISKKYK